MKRIQCKVRAETVLESLYAGGRKVECSVSGTDGRVWEGGI